MKNKIIKILKYISDKDILITLSFVFLALSAWFGYNIEAAQLLNHKIAFAILGMLSLSTASVLYIVQIFLWMKYE